MINKGFGIKDIAKMLGISASTVSRALRDVHDVNHETRAKVLKLAEELNFKINKNASALASGKTKNIGIVTPFITNYYFSKVISGIQEEAYLNGYNIILYITNDEASREQQIMESLDLSAIDGLLVAIASNTVNQEYFDEILNAGLPIVFFDRVPENILSSKVVQNDFEGAFVATTHLISKGYKRIAHLSGPQQLQFTSERLKGYKAALKRGFLVTNPDFIIHSGFSQEDGFEDCKKLFQLPNPPDAIFAINDRKAIGAIKALKNLGYNIPHDVAVIGFTNDPISTIIEPNLTTMEEPAVEIGKQSFQILMKHIKNKNFEPRSITLPCKLIERSSV